MLKDYRIERDRINLQALADLGIPEAVDYLDTLKTWEDPLQTLKKMASTRRVPLCVSCLTEPLYKRANELILKEANHVVLDVACGYSPRALLLKPLGYRYLGAGLSELAEVDTEIPTGRDAAPTPAGDASTPEGDAPTPEGDAPSNHQKPDIMDYDQMIELLGEPDGPITVVMEGLLPFLDHNKKLELAKNVRELLLRYGGCWVIPEGNPGSMVPDTFRAVLGKKSMRIFERMMAIRKSQADGNLLPMSWKQTDKTDEVLDSLGFKVRRVPLYSDDMELRCLKRVKKDAAARLRACWQDKCSFVASV